MNFLHALHTYQSENSAHMAMRREQWSLFRVSYVIAQAVIPCIDEYPALCYEHTDEPVGILSISDLSADDWKVVPRIRSPQKTKQRMADAFGMSVAEFEKSKFTITPAPKVPNRPVEPELLEKRSESTKAWWKIWR